MFKTTVSILFISVCLVMQYARQFAYLECKIENISSKAPVCDCEKKYDPTAGNPNTGIPPQKGHVHISFDEYDMPVQAATVGFYPGILNTYFNRNTGSLSSYYGNIFRPPKQA